MKSSPNCKAELLVPSYNLQLQFRLTIYNLQFRLVCSSGRRAYESLTKLVLINANRANNSRLYQPKYVQAYY